MSKQNVYQSCRYIQVGSFSIFVEIDGTGPCIILTHGLGANTNIFQPLVESLRHDYTTLRVDWPGHGHSSLDTTGASYGIPDLVHILTAVMDDLDIDKATLVGHSAGGIVSMMLAAQSPGRVSGLAVIGAGRTRSPPSESKDLTLYLAQQARKKGTEAGIDALITYNIPSATSILSRALLRAVTSSTSREGYAQLCEALCADSHIDPDYSLIQCPTCVVGGTLDSISPTATTDELVRLIGTSGRIPSRHILETGHMMIVEDVMGTLAAINTILV